MNSLGHSHPALVSALKDQAEKLWHVSNVYQIPGQEEFGRKLVEAVSARRESSVVFLFNFTTKRMHGVPVVGFI